MSCDVYQGASSDNTCGGAVRLVWFDLDGEWIGTNEGNIIKTSGGGTLSSLTASAPADGFVAPAANAFRKKQNKEMHIDNFAWNHTLHGRRKHERHVLRDQCGHPRFGRARGGMVWLHEHGR